MTAAAMDVTSQVELLDSEILKIEEGPLAWANGVSHSPRSYDDFANKLKDEFFKIGFYIYFEYGMPMECHCYPHHDDLQQCGRLQPISDAPLYPKITITGRTEIKPFDYEQMQHEVRNNILDMPGQDKGTIKFDEKEFLRRHGGRHLH